MGGEASSQEDMFAKLENMRAVITEVNTQFKDPVCSILFDRVRLDFSSLLRKKPPSFAFAYPSSYRYTRQSA